MLKIEFKCVILTCITLGRIPSVWSYVWSYSPQKRASDFYIHFKTKTQLLKKKQSRQPFVSAVVKGDNTFINTHTRNVVWYENVLSGTGCRQTLSPSC